LGRPEVNFIYLLTLAVALAGLVALDFTHKLAFTKNAKAALAATGIPYIFFVIWDFTGINLGIFFKGASPYLTGLMIARDFPVEELFFLAVLCYSTLIMATWLPIVLKRRQK
jgi:lycopene cyclase domain-containing protein